MIPTLCAQRRTCQSCQYSQRCRAGSPVTKMHAHSKMDAPPIQASESVLKALPKEPVLMAPSKEPVLMAPPKDLVLMAPPTMHMKVQALG